MVISVLVVALVYSPATTTFYVFAAPPVEEFLNSGDCRVPPSLQTGSYVTCCWNNMRGYLTCQTCQWTQNVGYSNCSNVESALEQTPTPPPSGPAAPLQDGVLEQPPGQGVAPPLTRGQGVLPQDGVLQQQEPADQGEAELQAPEETKPANAEEVPELVCPEGQVIDEETGLCVLEETEVVEEPEEQPTEEEADSSEENSNN
ncbi:MAG: hypothetical protein ACRD8W_13515 [Nitrososphaeraceae archaeon]